MTDDKTGGFAFPGEHSADAATVRMVRDESGLGMHDAAKLLSKHGGMTLRDWFATVVDKDEYGDILYRNMTQELKEALAGPTPNDLPKADGNDPVKRAAWRLANLDHELRVRAAIRYRMADAMIAERSKP